MAQFIPLPDELVRKVFGYILPIFDFATYNQSMRKYNDTQLEMTLLCHDCQDMIYEGSAARKLDILDELTILGEVQKKYLVVIKAFLEKNPRFVRPVHSNQLHEHQYLRAFDYEITVCNMVRFDDNIMIRRGMWEYPETKMEILLYTETVQLLYDGSLRDLIYSCIVNNVGGFRVILENHVQKAFREVWDYEIHRFINQQYSDMESNAMMGMREGLVRSLMKM
jgi:hypothetical protein